jgi:hypothetical protein
MIYGGRIMEIKIYDYLHEDSIYIRTEVFVKEQGFVDEFLEENCPHITMRKKI